MRHHSGPRQWTWRTCRGKEAFPMAQNQHGSCHLAVTRGLVCAFLQPLLWSVVTRFRAHSLGPGVPPLLSCHLCFALKKFSPGPLAGTPAAPCTSPGPHNLPSSWLPVSHGALARLSRVSTATPRPLLRAGLCSHGFTSTIQPTTHQESPNTSQLNGAHRRQSCPVP